MIATTAQALADGMAIGASYALLALAFTLLWATVRTVNLALLQTLAISALVCFAMARFGAPVAFAAAAVTGLGVGIATHLVAVQSTISKGQLYPIIASLGVGLLLQGGMSLTVGDNLRTMPTLLPSGLLRLQGVFISWASLIILLVTVICLFGIAALSRVTTLGLAFRASAWQPALAATYGVDVRRIRLISAGAAGALTGLSGAFTAVLGGSVSPTLGASAGLNGLVGMLIGGAGNPAGAVVGGLTVGGLQSLAGEFAPTSIKGIVSLALLFLILIVRPSGLMRER